MTAPLSPTALSQVASWAGSALAAAAVLSGLGALSLGLPAPGESRGAVVAPVLLTLMAPEAVTALPTPPPLVNTAAAPPPKAPSAAPAPPRAPLAEPAPDLAALPTLPAPPPAADLPRQVDPVPPPPAAPKPPEPAPQTAAAPEPAKPKAAPPAPTPAPAAKAPTGDAGKSVTATRSDGSKAGTAQAKQAMQGWGSDIRKRIEARKAYPAAARGAQGTVTVRLTVSRAGKLLGVSVATSSGDAALDRAAIKAVQSARLPRAPAAVTADSASFTLPMKFAN